MLSPLCHAQARYGTLTKSNQQFPKNFHDIITGTRDQFSLILQILDNSKSTGLDKIRNLILKQLSNSLSVSLHSIFKTCLNKRKYPSQWKESVITPTYNDGKNTAIKNYRPIKCLSRPSKILKKTVFDGLLKCSNDQIHDSQYVFRPTRSTTIQVLCFLHEIYTFNDQKLTEQLAVLYLVFQESSTK